MTMEEDLKKMSASEPCPHKEYELKRLTHFLHRVDICFDAVEVTKNVMSEQECELIKNIQSSMIPLINHCSIIVEALRKDNCPEIGSFMDMKSQADEILKHLGSLKLPQVKPRWAEFTDAGPGVGVNNIDVKNVHSTPLTDSKGNDRGPDDWQPRANIKKLFEQKKLSLEDNEEIKKFSQAFIVDEKYVRSYLEHLSSLETISKIREKQRKDARQERKKKEVSDYNWQELIENGKLPSLVVSELDKYLIHYNLSKTGKKKDKIRRITVHYYNQDRRAVPDDQPVADFDQQFGSEDSENESDSDEDLVLCDSSSDSDSDSSDCDGDEEGGSAEGTGRLLVPIQKCGTSYQALSCKIRINYF
ncbi:predicted protein [Nematostella vectensis]|uniref:Transient receptor potential cation channel subfamily A member 1 n=1 Tax=Nematostella vectensis TaxID=45351 RepID=A7SNJ6_NEMVE|nr:predicted protein [Nematostella vectensis]|eukprot:XP_001626813.1 predicted protein [Nematostella vectensis]